MVAKPQRAARALASGAVAGGVAAVLYLLRREQRIDAELERGPEPAAVRHAIEIVPVARTVEPETPEPSEVAPSQPARRRPVRVDWRYAIGILAIVAIAVPWFIPGFARSVDERFGSSTSVTDPSVIASPSGSASSAALSGRLGANGAPIRVTIPRLQVDSAVIPISGASGALFPPNNPAVIGWWQEGPKPGDANGTTLLTGHTVHTGGGAFDKLDAMQPGDTFVIATGIGTITYKVTDVTNYTKGRLADVASQLFRLDGPPEVLLITCANWDGHQFLDNTVVTGVPIAFTAPSASAPPSKATAGSSHSASPSPSVRTPRVGSSPPTLPPSPQQQPPTPVNNGAPPPAPPTPPASSASAASEPSSSSPSSPAASSSGP